MSASRDHALVTGSALERRTRFSWVSAGLLLLAAGLLVAGLVVGKIASGYFAAILGVMIGASLGGMVRDHWWRQQLSDPRATRAPIQSKTGD